MSGSKVSISGIGSGDTTARVEALVQALAHQAFADQAALAIENAQLYETLRRHADELEQHVADPAWERSGRQITGQYRRT